jgi:hypothetical protein
MCGFKNASNEPPCSNLLCPWLWKIWQLPNTRIRYVIPLYVEVVINLIFESLNEEIMFTYNKQHQLLWMQLQDVLFYMCGRFFLWSVVGKLRWSDMERPCAQLCTMSYSQCGWPNGPILSCGSNWPTMYVAWASFRNCHYVDLWQVFSRLAYGMFHATNGRSVS